MKKYRVFFIKNGIKLTRLVYAESLLDVISLFPNINIISILEIDTPSDED